ncbi:hypothetical protein BZA77DRAFT_86717 [Pyronema omphalodes]|nr:hypothetical protein BZA77DRAFT_86717 [Pyronema omphalodes]
MSTQVPLPTPVAPANPAHALRLAARTATHTSPTAGYAPGHIQANLLVLPSAYANDFRLLCLRNPVPCPLLAISSSTGSATSVTPNHLFSTPFDIRTDIPRYNIYNAGKIVESSITDLKDYWTNDHVAFLIGCSFSFEGALEAAGLPPRHVVKKCNVSMYKTTLPLCPAGVFTEGSYVVSMRPYKKEDVERVRDITRPFREMHGEPIAWGWEGAKKLGIEDVSKPDFGDAVEIREGEVPVFWGCGVTPQAVVMAAGDKIKGNVLAHEPGHMMILDVREEEWFGRTAKREGRL